MNTHALRLREVSYRLQQAGHNIPARISSFLEALTHCEYGHLRITDPYGKSMEFMGTMPGPSAYLRLHDWGALEELMVRGDIGFAEAYIDQRWDSIDLPALLTYGLLNAEKLEHFFHGRPLHILWLKFQNWMNGNSIKGSRRNIMAHYDLGNEFYALWLDRSMTYSGALFEGDQKRSLEEAQQAKYRRILNRLDAAPGSHILDIGCGWGGFAEMAALRGLRVTAITLSAEQAQYAKDRLRQQGIDLLVSVEIKDYREIEGQFDHIVSIGMFEHVGQEYWPAYFETVRRCLKPGGKAMIQTIVLDDNIFESRKGGTGFIEYYIFPGGMLPSHRRFHAATERAGLTCRNVYMFGKDYARTLRCWLTRFESRKSAMASLGFDHDFIRLWRFYLASSIASFESGRADLMQTEITHV